MSLEGQGHGSGQRGQDTQPTGSRQTPLRAGRPNVHRCASTTAPYTQLNTVYTSPVHTARPCLHSPLHVTQPLLHPPQSHSSAPSTLPPVHTARPRLHSPHPHSSTPSTPAASHSSALFTPAPSTRLSPVYTRSRPCCGLSLSSQCLIWGLLPPSPHPMKTTVSQSWAF